MMSDLVDALRLQQPSLILPGRPAWLSLYGRAWQAFCAADSPAPAPAYAAIRAWRAAGEEEAAGQAAAEFLDRLAASDALPAGEALAALLLLIEEILGLDWLAGEEQLVWTLREEPPLGVQNLRLGDNLVSLLALEDDGRGIIVEIQATQPFNLQIDNGFNAFSEHLPAGTTRLILTHLDRTDVRSQQGGVEAFARSYGSCRSSANTVTSSIGIISLFCV